MKNTNYPDGPGIDYGYLHTLTVEATTPFSTIVDEICLMCQFGDP